MSTNNLFSFESPDSIQFSFSFGSFSINAKYMAKMKFFFNDSSIYPTKNTKRIVKHALRMVNNLLTGQVQSELENDPQLYYFAETFLDSKSQYYSNENFLYLKKSLHELIKDIDLWLEQNAAKERQKKAAIDKEIKSIIAEEEYLKKRIREIVHSCKRDLSHDEIRYFMNIGDGLKYTYGDWLYHLIQDNEVADFYFLYNKDATELKSKFIIQCIENGNFQLALDLINRICKSTSFENTSRIGYTWEKSAVFTITDVLSEYARESLESMQVRPDETRRVVIDLAEHLLPELSEASQKELLGYFAAVELKGPYTEKYLAALSDDVDHYAQIPRPRGWGKETERITSEIVHSFSILEDLGRVDTIISILSKLKAAGSKLKPIDFNSWLDMCKNRVSDQTYMAIRKAL